MRKECRIRSINFPVLVFFGAACLQWAAGASADSLVLTVGGDAKPIEFDAPPRALLLFSYEDNYVEIRDPNGVVIPDGGYYRSPVLSWTDGDYDGDNDFDLKDIEAFMKCFSADEAAGGDCALVFDYNGDNKVNLEDWKVLGPLMTPPGCCPPPPSSPLTFYARGLAPTPSLESVSIRVYIEATMISYHPATVVGLTVSAPETVLAGDLIQLGLTPTGSGLTFSDAATTASFEDPNLPVSMSFAAGEVFVPDPNQAVVVAGSGTSSGITVASLLASNGELSGTASAVLSDGSYVEGEASLTFGQTVARFYRFLYGATWNDILSNPATSLSIAHADYGVQPEEQVMMWSTLHHYVIGIQVKQNQYSADIPSIVASVVTMDSGGSSVVDIAQVTLTPLDSGVSPIQFVSNPARPLIPYAVPVDRGACTVMVPFTTSHGGKAYVMPGEVLP